jgi:hypothetical protein
MTSLTDKIKAIRRPMWLRRSLDEGKAYPWLVAVKELAR